MILFKEQEILKIPKQRIHRKQTKDSKRLATVAAKRRSPAKFEIKKMYSGALTWFDLWVRPTTQNLQTLNNSYQTNCKIASIWYFNYHKIVYPINPLE